MAGRRIVLRVTRSGADRAPVWHDIAVARTCRARGSTRMARGGALCPSAGRLKAIG
jgi:hypothetical protein